VFENGTRRQFLVGGATVASGALVYGATTEKASATVNVEALNIPNDSYTLADQTMEDVQLSVDTSYSWEGNAEIHKYELRLAVGTTRDTAAVIARKEQTELGKQSLSGNAQLNGSILSSPSFSQDNFNPSRGTLTTDMVVVLVFDLYRDGEIVETAKATDTAELSVTAEELEYTVSVEGSGSVKFQTA
jgi:hypothetical protein